MSWGVHSIQDIFPILQSSVLGVYGDSSLLFEGIAVHEALLGGRMPTVRQQPVHERCLAVIHMSCASYLPLKSSDQGQISGANEVKPGVRVGFDAAFGLQ